jgi:glucosamine--fructose-6-phosphate aminotransferase (isomerizing)
MCGIVGYIGQADAAPILLDGLRRLEYRGYDSAGVAIIEDGAVHVRKSVGRIANLASLLQSEPLRGTSGICHTRWATHGGVTNENAHPHFDQGHNLALVHNGVIENYQTLRDELIRDGHLFQSQTDTEVLAHLIGKYYDAARGEPSKGRLIDAVRSALKQVIGTYGIAAREPAGAGHREGGELSGQRRERGGGLHAGCRVPERLRYRLPGPEQL